MQFCKHPVCYALASSNLAPSAIDLVTVLTFLLTQSLAVSVLVKYPDLRVSSTYDYLFVGDEHEWWNQGNQNIAHRVECLPPSYYLGSVVSVADRRLWE